MLGKIRSLLFQNTSVRQTVVKNTFWLMFGELVGRLIRAFIVIYAARLLGAGEYGVFSYAMAVAAFLTIFSDIGVSAILTRESVKNPELRQNYFSTAFLIKCLLIIINIGILIFLFPLITKIEGAKVLFPFVAIVLTFDSLREFGLGLNRALERMEREAFVKIILNLSVAILGFLFLLKVATAKSLILAYGLSTGVGFLVIAWVLRQYIADLFKHIRLKLIWPILSLAWPIGVLGVLGAVMINTDMVMLGWWLDKTKVGLYAAAQKPIQLFYIIPTLIASAVFPTFARLANTNPERFRIVLQKSLTLIMLLAIPMVAGGLILAPQIVHFIYGAEYAPAALTFQILMATLFLVFPNVVLTNALFAYNAQKHFVKFVAVGAISNALFNYLLIPPYGIEGAAIATIISQLLTSALVWLQMRRLNNFAVLPYLGKILLAGLAMSGLTYALAQTTLPLLANISISIVTYFLLLIVLKEPLTREVASVVRT